MQSSELFNFLPEHNVLWQRFLANFEKNRLSHATLLVGALHANLLNFGACLAATIFCKKSDKPCGNCQSCNLVRSNQHPDLNYLVPDKEGSPIKIDQIRELYTYIYTSPRISENRVVIIHPAEKMNIAAANALLKILEEPPENTYFILIAEQISTIPVTVISRCQLWRVPIAINDSLNYLNQASYYSSDSERGKVFSQLSNIITDLLALLAGKLSVNQLAQKWTSFDFKSLLWLLYLITAQMITQYFYSGADKSIQEENLDKLAQLIKPVCLFKQMDKLNAVTGKLNHTVSVNQLLVLEDLLIGFTTNT